jgi:membrane-associated protease RseP (regulator of RpoE activity)
MKSCRQFCLIASVVAAALLHSSCALLPSVSLPWLNYSASTSIGIQHMNIGVRGVWGSSKLKHVVIESIKGGSAASRAGIISGDKIVSIDGAKIASLSVNEFKALFTAFEYAAPGSKITFEVVSPGAEGSRRAEVVIPPKKPNKALEPTATSVMPRAIVSSSEMKRQTQFSNQARVMPAVPVAHL